MSELRIMGEARAEAFIEQDWPRYNEIGEKILALLDERPARLDFKETHDT